MQKPAAIAIYLVSSVHFADTQCMDHPDTVMTWSKWLPKWTTQMDHSRIKLNIITKTDKGTIK